MLGTYSRARRITRDMMYAATSQQIQVRKCAPADVAGINNHIREHGWVIVRGVFSAAEVLGMRSDVLRSKRDGVRGDLLSNQYLRKVLLDRRFLSAVEAVVGSSPVYFGDSNWSADYYPGTIGFHKDNPDKERQDAPDWGAPYTIFRFGMYLHDCSYYSGGLCLRDRSHNGVSVLDGQPFAVPSQPGDIVAWSLRTTHSGYATRLRLLPRLFVPLPLLARLAVRGGHYRPPRALFRDMQYPDRLALFASFGRRDAHLERYLMYLQGRQYFVQSIHESVWHESVLEEARQQGLDVISLHDALRSVDVSKLNRDHVPLPP